MSISFSKGKESSIPRVALGSRGQDGRTQNSETVISHFRAGLGRWMSSCLQSQTPHPPGPTCGVLGAPVCHCHSAGHTLAGGQSFPVCPKAPPQGLSGLPATLLQGPGPHCLSALPGPEVAWSLLTSFKCSVSFNHHWGPSVVSDGTGVVLQP